MATKPIDNEGASELCDKIQRAALTPCSSDGSKDAQPLSLCASLNATTHIRNKEAPTFSIARMQVGGDDDEDGGSDDDDDDIGGAAGKTLKILSIT